MNKLNAIASGRLFVTIFLSLVLVVLICAVFDTVAISLCGSGCSNLLKTRQNIGETIYDAIPVDTSGNFLLPLIILTALALLRAVSAFLTRLRAKRAKRIAGVLHGALSLCAVCAAVWFVVAHAAYWSAFRGKSFARDRRNTFVCGAPGVSYADCKDQGSGAARRLVLLYYSMQINLVLFYIGVSLVTLAVLALVIFCLVGLCR
eukprot:gnl/Chilomastix_cuspidata/6418.p1 GENE.gnl/Chilomastix_cuspidata/6418~~gnl/Chilomastix_cuspidata/6418.p1  ORF type:complete len:204 (+),score=48.44 gnl/Chilomastix_cuspidata/6418:56-667(+)